MIEGPHAVLSSVASVHPGLLDVEKRCTGGFYLQGYYSLLNPWILLGERDGGMHFRRARIGPTGVIHAPTTPEARHFCGLPTRWHTVE